MSGASRYRYTRAMRLLKTDEFSSVFNFRLSVANDWFQLLGRPNGLDHARLGVVAGRKVDRRAVVRNYVKRTCREQFRLHGTPLAGVDLVVRVKKRFTRREGAEARAALLSLFGRLARRIEGSR
ncbi:ribonuclease P protein component [Chitinibacteraceae bacterium HSL-7]